MIVSRTQILELVQREYRLAKKEHRPLASLAEGYAVLLEEVEETEEALAEIRDGLHNVWRDVRENVKDDRIAIAAVQACAVKTACEALQVAAVCKRIMDFFEGEAQKNGQK